jgi:FKBP-type peptidyl-prolyl cis-trans isomerase
MKDQKGNTGVIVSFIIVALLVVGIVYLLMHQTQDANSAQGVQTDQQTDQTAQPSTTDQTSAQGAQSTQQQSASTTNMQPQRMLAGFTPIASVPTLQKIDLTVGTGAEVQPGATVSVQYTGAVAATGVIFQSSKDFGTDPVTFPLSGVIKGWTDGIPGMKVGGTRRLIIPAAQAYGANPPAGSGIPANADLVFDVELVAIK